jgi:membrane associated rhomboid family serine protease
MTTPRHRPWALGTSDAESVLAEARKALFVMVAFLAIIWIAQLANVLDHYQLTTDYGIRARDVSSLPEIVSAPFLHVSWTHIESNSGPLFIFGFLAAYRGVVRFLGLTGLVIIASGLADWSFGAPHSIGVGASGVVFGYLGYILVRGFFDRHGIDILIGAVMALCFAYQFTVLLPRAGIGWQAHIGGLVAGVVGGWIFRDRNAKAARKQAKAAVGQPATAVAVPGTATGTVIGASAKSAVAQPTAGQPTAGQPTARQPTVGKAAAGKPAASKQAVSAAEIYSGPRGDIYRQLDDLDL